MCLVKNYFKLHKINFNLLQKAFNWENKLHGMVTQFTGAFPL